ncbi:MAG: phosphoribosyl-AMP cyclohydrolase [Micropruina sp.]|uniref:phosphoribosyl-AMP cyclohydrolase n=1 Tax=Micropruina sp. TaxID=2737536 RepID=UPI0039E3A73E
MSLDPAVAARLKRNPDQLVPAIVQDATSREVLMLAWMDDEALARTLSSRRGTYWSRSRREYWVKGETSGHTQHVRQVSLDCDGDTLLVLVDQTGPACHTGTTSCFTDRALLTEPSSVEPGATTQTEESR